MFNFRLDGASSVERRFSGRGVRMWMKALLEEGGSGERDSLALGWMIGAGRYDGEWKKG